MNRWTHSSVIFLCAVSCLVNVAFAQENFPAGSNNLGKVLLVARDRSGKVVADLKPEDITVVDNGKQANVLGLEPAGNLPLRLGILLIDDETTFKTQQEAAVQLLSALRPGIDQAFVLTQATSPKPRPWPNSQLKWVSDFKALTVFVRSLHSNESLLSTTDIATQMLELRSETPFRRTMFEFRNPYVEGTIDWGPMPYKELEARQISEISELQRLNAAVYTCAIKTTFHPPYGGTSGPVNLSIETYTLQDGMQKIERTALATGGRHLDWNKLKTDVTELQRDLQAQLLLTFAFQPNNQQQLSHSLEIRTNRKDVRIFSPKQFYPSAATAP